MRNTITVRVDLERIVLMVRWNCVPRYVIWNCFVVFTRGQLQSSWQRQLATVSSASRRWPSEESSENTEAAKYRSSQVPSEDDATNRYAQQWRVHPCMTLCVCIATCVARSPLLVHRACISLYPVIFKSSVLFSIHPPCYLVHRELCFSLLGWWRKYISSSSDIFHCTSCC